MVKLADVLVDQGQAQGRVQFTFPYNGSEIMEACQKQAAYHREREQYYDTEVKALEPKMKRSVKVKTQQVTGGPQFMAEVNQTIAAQHAEAKQRRDAHAGKAKRFEAYVGAFSTQQGIQFRLTIEDVDYFALHRDPGD